MNRICNVGKRKSVVAHMPQINIINKLLKMPYARSQKRIFVYYAALALILVFFQLFFTTSASAFQVGDRVKATENLNVRSTPGGIWVDQVPYNTLGIIVDGPQGATYSGAYYIWYKVDWDSTYNTGWSVEDGLTAVTSTPTPSISYFDPTSLTTSDSYQYLNIHGSGFTSSSLVDWQNGGDSGTIPSSRTTYYSSTKLRIQFNTTSTGYGTWNFRVKNGTKASSWKSFTVNQANSADPEITIGPPSLNFTSVQVGSCSSASFAIQHVVNTSTASGTVSISQNPPFRVTSNSSFSLSNSQAVNVNVEFCPTSSGSFSGSAIISSNAAQNINSVNLSGTGSIPSPTTGVIQVKAKLDGTSWSGSVNYSVSGAQNFSGNSVPADFQDRPQGNYTLTYVSGGPANSTFSNITPSSSQTLNGGSVITFTLNFMAQTSNQSPEAKFTMTSGGQTAYENQTLNLTVSSGGTAQVSFSGSRSFDPDGSISSYLWTINGTQVSTSRDFSSSLGKGTHQIYLTVTDNQGAEGSVGGTVVVTDQTSNQSPVAKFTMTSGGQTADENQTLNLTVSSGGTAQVSFSGSRSFDPDANGSVSSYLWKINSAQVSTSKDFDSSLAEGTHQVYLTVTDNQEAEGSVGGTVVVTDQTSNQSPEAQFTMTSGNQTAYENQTLNLTVSSGVTAQVSFSGSRSSDPDGSISGYLWTINGDQAGTSRDFSSSLGKGTHQVYLTVTDNQGAEGSVGASIIIEETSLSPTIPTLKWPLNGSLNDGNIETGFKYGDDWIVYGNDGTIRSCGNFYKKHVGVDLNYSDGFKAKEGDPVYAAEAGTVESIYFGGTGIVIQHTGFTTTYLHVAPFISEGEDVSKGEKIATISYNAGHPHLHFGVRTGTYSESLIPESVSYSAERGALPQINGDSNYYDDGKFSGCKDDPTFPGKFIDPETLSFESNPSPPTEPTLIEVPGIKEGYLLGSSSENRYEFDIPPPSVTEITISLFSTDFDTFLTLYKSDKWYAEDNNGHVDWGDSEDDDDFGTNSEISGYLNPGTYTIGVTRNKDSETQGGEYLLVVRDDIGNREIETICDKRWEKYPAVFPGPSHASGTPNDWVAKLYKIGGEDCFGRCGTKCPDDFGLQCNYGFGLPAYRYTIDCFNHDACCRYYESCTKLQCERIFDNTFDILADDGDCEHAEDCGPDFSVGKSDSSDYSKIQFAIDAGNSGTAIKIQSGIWSEHLTSTPETLILRGGWDETFTNDSSTSTVNSLTITDGKIIVDNLVIQ